MTSFLDSQEKISIKKDYGTFSNNKIIIGEPYLPKAEPTVVPDPLPRVSIRRPGVIF